MIVSNKIAKLISNIYMFKKKEKGTKFKNKKLQTIMINV